MKLFVYSLRMFDEKKYFDEWSEKLGVEYSYCQERPTPDNMHLVKGYDAVSVLTTPVDEEILKAWKEDGVKVVSTRTVGFDHIDCKAAKALSMPV